MKVTFAVGGLTIDWGNGTRQVVMFGGRGAALGEAVPDGSMAKALGTAMAACPVILWDEAGELQTPGLAARS